MITFVTLTGQAGRTVEVVELMVRNHGVIGLQLHDGHKKPRDESPAIEDKGVSHVK